MTTYKLTLNLKKEAYGETIINYFNSNVENFTNLHFYQYGGIDTDTTDNRFMDMSFDYVTVTIKTNKDLDFLLDFFTISEVEKEKKTFIRVVTEKNISIIEFEQIIKNSKVNAVIDTAGYDWLYINGHSPESRKYQKVFNEFYIYIWYKNTREEAIDKILKARDEYFKLEPIEVEEPIKILETYNPQNEELESVEFSNEIIYMDEEEEDEEEFETKNLLEFNALLNAKDLKPDTSEDLKPGKDDKSLFEVFKELEITIQRKTEEVNFNEVKDYLKTIDNKFIFHNVFKHEDLIIAKCNYNTTYQLMSYILKIDNFKRNKNFNVFYNINNVKKYV